MGRKSQKKVAVENQRKVGLEEWIALGLAMEDWMARELVTNLFPATSKKGETAVAAAAATLRPLVETELESICGPREPLTWMERALFGPDLSPLFMAWHGTCD